MTLVITVDGPSGSGKGTLCQLLARKFGLRLLDSGALYRLTALAALNQDIDFADESSLAIVAQTLDVRFEPTDQGVRVWLVDEDVTSVIRQEHVGMHASKVAACPAVREALLGRQRDFAQLPGLVADGRDMGTTVFPEAPVKVFLTASADERATRRVAQLESAGVAADYQKILSDIEQRDKQDRERAVSPLVPADDAHLVDSTDMTIDEVLALLESLVRDYKEQQLTG